MRTISKYFEFDKKIGWSQVFSLVALAVSFWSLWLAYQKSGPKILVSRDTSIGGQFFDETKSYWRWFGYERIVLSNIGGAAVTLVGLRSSKGQFAEMISFIIKDRKAEEVKCEVLIVNEFFEDLKNDPRILSVYRGWPLEKLGSLYRMIPPGGTVTLNVAVLYDAYNGRTPVADYIFTNLELSFSDGTVRPYQVAAQVEPVH